MTAGPPRAPEQVKRRPHLACSEPWCLNPVPLKNLEAGQHVFHRENSIYSKGKIKADSYSFSDNDSTEVDPQSQLL